MNSSLEKKVEELINDHSAESGSMTPDFILAKYLMGCLKIFNETTVERDRWWSHKPVIGGSPEPSKSEVW